MLAATSALAALLLSRAAAWLPRLAQASRVRSSRLPRRGKAGTRNVGGDSYLGDNYWSKKAKDEGVPARSYYKLEEIDQRLGIFQPGHRVLDLGCYPGSWTLYAAKRVGDQGRILGIDLREVTLRLPFNCKTRVEDAYKFRGGNVPQLDVVMSDMAPSLGVAKEFDHLESCCLVELAMGIADAKLKRGGAMIAKLIQGGRFEELMFEMRLRYDNVRQMRPRATRKQSKELYLIGIGKKVRSDRVPAKWQPLRDRTVQPKVRAPRSFDGW